MKFREVKRLTQGHTAKNGSAQAHKLPDHTDFPKRHRSRMLFKMPAGASILTHFVLYPNEGFQRTFK